MLGIQNLAFLTCIWSIMLYFCLTDVKCSVISQKIDAEDKSKGPQVLLSVSPLASHNSDGVITERLLELNWFDAPPGMNEDSSSLVGLYNHDPSTGIDDPLEVAHTKANPDGYYRTKVTFPHKVFQASNLNDECLGYWIGYINLNRLVAKSCIRAQPHWMYNMRDVIGNRTLLDLMLPGTHNAGSYQRYDPERNTPKIRYQMCQDEDIWNQLVYGNRFLDLRVIFQHVAGSKEKFWITHGPLRTNNSVRSVLLQVKQFMNNTNEIVIMDFHLFYMGFIDSWIENRHKELMNLIVHTLGDYMMPTSFEFRTTLNQMWKSNKRLMVGYADNRALQNNLLYPGVPHLWPNKETRKELEEFLERTMCRIRYGRPWSAMAELTPTTTGVILDKYGSLRTLAQDINFLITKWFRDRWWKCANIVATDYFLGNNIIDVSIEVNKKK